MFNLLDGVFAEGSQAFEAYNLVRGRKRAGYIVDPGAASGIAGTDTIIEHNRSPTAHYRVLPGGGNFSGINGTPTPGCGRLEQSDVIGRLPVTWSGDIIGSTGSCCPYLLPLPPLIKYRAILIHGITSDDGGAIVLTNIADPTDMHVFRLLHTDSGHYLLPTDMAEEQREDEPVISSIVLDCLEAVARNLRRDPGQQY